LLIIASVLLTPIAHQDSVQMQTHANQLVLFPKGLVHTVLPVRVKEIVTV